MRKVKTNNISTSVGMPVKSGTLDHIQLAYQEAISSMMNNILGRVDNTNAYILHGCVNTGSGLNYIISAGAIYYLGEVFLVDATTFTAASGQVAVANVTETFYNVNADPVQLTDGNTYNVHSIRKITFASGATGSGLFDFSALLTTPLQLRNDQQATLGATYTVKFDQDKAVFFASATVDTTFNFDFTNAVPGTVVRLKWAYGAGRAITISTPSGAAIVKDFGTLASVASSTNLLYFLYVGKNASGDNEVSYSLKQV